MNGAHLPEVMVSMARNRSVPEVLEAIVGGIADCRNVVLARIWLIEMGDICEECRFRVECPDQTRCLHLVASAGRSVDPAAGHGGTDGVFRRFPLGVRKIGRVGQSGLPLRIPGVTGGEEWVADPDWVRREGVRTFAAQPLVFGGEVLGVLAVFDKDVLSEADFEWLRVLADHAAVTLANARAFEEIEYLKARLEEENIYLRREISEVSGSGGMVGDGPGLTKVLRQIQLVAPTDATVLITGESGTGKELVARAIHDASPRRDRALIKVNCGAVPETLFESEFFGHVKGAFTGAMRDRPGRFELADGGTLFLDEIGEVPLSLQAKLLRVLQDQEIERVGDTRVRKVDVRIVAATNRDLKREVEAGRFRRDLFYRLSVFPVETPPLRERREDIPLLARHFLERAALRMNRSRPRVPEAALRRLADYDWPGNVRELENAVERALILWRGGPMDFGLPGAGTVSGGASGAGVGAGEGGEGVEALMTRDELRRRERGSIEAALERAGGKVSGPGGAAELLGMRPTTLASRIKALGIRRGR